MRKKPEIDKEEQTLFRSAMRGVKTLKPPTKVNQTQAPIKHIAKAHIPQEPMEDPFSDYESLPAVGGDDIIEYFRPGIQHKVLRNLRTGKYNVEAILDLHGMTVVEARQSLNVFLLRCRQRGIQHALIIHGKGRRSTTPILKNKVNHWLRQTEQVLGFCSATLKHGRGGSLYVLLKASSSKKS